MQHQTQHGLMELIDFFFKKNINRGFNVKLAEAAKDETTYFQGVGVKVQVQILTVKNKFVTDILLQPF